MAQTPQLFLVLRLVRIPVFFVFCLFGTMQLHNRAVFRHEFQEVSVEVCPMLKTDIFGRSTGRQ